jgi:hypothetical protein
MSSDRVTASRVEFRRPGANGLGGGSFVSCRLAGRRWRLRFYGREPVPQKDDATAWQELSAEQRKRLAEAALAELEEAELGRIRRENHERRVRSGLRWIVGTALHDKQRASQPVTVAPQRPRQAPRASTRRHAGRTRTGGRGDPDSSRSEDEPPLADLGRTAAASARMVARIARRERRRFQRAGEVAA